MTRRAMATDAAAWAALLRRGLRLGWPPALLIDVLRGSRFIVSRGRLWIEREPVVS